MPRALTILKYLPVVLCGLLMAVWVVSEFEAIHRFRSGLVILAIDDGSLEFRRAKFASSFPTTDAHSTDLAAHLPARRFYIGRFYSKAWTASWSRNRTSEKWLEIDCPIPYVLAHLLLLAGGCLNRFRFPLWMWFAFTALVAVGCAQYLR